MAVYFQPQYKPWWADLANTALKEGLSGLMKGMFERDAAARTKNRYNKEWAQAWEGYGGQPTGAQSTSAQQPAAMSIESAPEVRGIGQIANPASMQSATGNDALGAALKTQGITVPKEYLPNGNDGLLGTSIKANLANNYVQSQMPSREEFIRRLGMVMSPQNMELALKQADYMMGPRWKVDDQIYKGRQLENVLGSLPGMQDKEGNRNYNNRAYMYGLDNAANGNLNFLNPEYKRWFDEAENERKRAFDARENALTRNAQMAIHRMNNAAAMQRAQLMYGAKGAAGAGTGGGKPITAKEIADLAAKLSPYTDQKEAYKALVGYTRDRAPEFARQLASIKTFENNVENPLYGWEPEENIIPAGAFRPRGYYLLGREPSETGSASTPAPTPAPKTTEGELNPDTVVGAPALAGTAPGLIASAAKEFGNLTDQDVYDYMETHPGMSFMQARSEAYNANKRYQLEKDLLNWWMSRGAGENPIYGAR